MDVNCQDRQRLLSLLKAKSFRQGKFVLSSGKESDFYIDCRQTSLSAEGHLLIGRLMFRAIQDHFPSAQAVGGPTLGADPLVSAVSLVSWLEHNPMDAFIIRKKPKSHGTGEWIEGRGNLQKGTEVVILEDTLTSGSTILWAIDRAEEAELRVLGAVGLVDRCEGARQSIEKTGQRLVCLFERKDFIPSPQED